MLLHFRLPYKHNLRKLDVSLSDNVAMKAIVIRFYYYYAQWGSLQSKIPSTKHTSFAAVLRASALMGEFSSGSIRGAAS